MDGERATPDEFETIIELPAPPLAPRRWRPGAFWRDARRGVLGAVVVVGAAVALLCGGAYLMFLPYELAHTTNPKDYPSLLTSFQDRHGNVARFLPPSIPAGATEVRVDANTRGMFQAEPYLRLGFRFATADAAAEITRLESLGPLSSDVDSAPPGLLHDQRRLFENARSYSFASRTSRVWADAWHDPDTGWFTYELTSD